MKKRNEGLEQLQQALKKQRLLTCISTMPPDAMILQDAEGRHWLVTCNEQMTLDI